MIPLYDPTNHQAGFSRNVLFLENLFYYQLNHDSTPSSTSNLHFCLDTAADSPQGRFKEGVIYKQLEQRDGLSDTLD